MHFILYRVKLVYYLLSFIERLSCSVKVAKDKLYPRTICYSKDVGIL